MAGVTVPLGFPYPTAPDLVQGVDDAIKALAEAVDDAMPRAGSCVGASQVIGNAAFTVLTPAEVFDPDGWHAAGTWTLPLAGVYLLTVGFTIPASAAAGNHRLACTFLAPPASAYVEDMRAGSPINATASLGASLSTIRHLPAGYRVQFQAYQDSGANMTITNVRTGVARLCPA